MENYLLLCILPKCGQELAGNLCTDSLKDASGPYDLRFGQANLCLSKNQSHNFRHQYLGMSVHTLHPLKAHYIAVVKILFERMGGWMDGCGEREKQVG